MIRVTKLIFGCGYLGQRVAERWLRQGDTVYALTRSAARARSLQAAGLRALVGEIQQPAMLRDLPVADTVLFAVGYERGSPGSMRDVYVDGLRHVLQALPPGTGRLIYVSSTGVYGQADGSWVDESSRCEPTRAGGAACWEAERLLLGSSWAEQAIVLRMSGLYGPGRIPRRRELEAGRPLAAPPTGFLNLVHVADAARAVLAVARDAPLPQVYCVSDGQPVVRGEYYRYLAELLGAPAPIFIEPPADSPAALRAGASKRVSSARFCQRFAFRFEYSSYREGLAAAVAAER